MIVTIDTLIILLSLLSIILLSSEHSYLASSSSSSSSSRLKYYIRNSIILLYYLLSTVPLSLYPILKWIFVPPISYPIPLSLSDIALTTTTISRILCRPSLYIMESKCDDNEVSGRKDVKDSKPDNDSKQDNEEKQANEEKSSSFISSSSSSSISISSETKIDDKNTDINRNKIQPLKELSFTPTESMTLLMEAIAYVYQRIIGKGDDNGELKKFLEMHAPKFIDLVEDEENHTKTNREEHRLEWQVLYKEYEIIIDKALNDFAIKNNMEPQDVSNTIENAISSSSSIDEKTIGTMSKYLNLLLAAGSYKKFVQLMKSKARDFKRHQRTTSESVFGNKNSNQENTMVEEGELR